MAVCKIEVVFAKGNLSAYIALTVPMGTTIEQCIQLSGLDQEGGAVGSYGKLRARSDLVKEGDRIEIYPALAQSPLEARKSRIPLKRRVKKRWTRPNQRKKLPS